MADIDRFCLLAGATTSVNAIVAFPIEDILRLFALLSLLLKGAKSVRRVTR